MCFTLDTLLKKFVGILMEEIYISAHIKISVVLRYLDIEE
jgi:hypothetical protein